MNFLTLQEMNWNLIHHPSVYTEGILDAIMCEYEMQYHYRKECLVPEMEELLCSETISFERDYVVGLHVEGYDGDEDDDLAMADYHEEFVQPLEYKFYQDVEQMIRRARLFILDDVTIGKKPKFINVPWNQVW